MKKELFALALLVVLLLPMLAGIRRIRDIRRDQPPPDDSVDD